MKKEKPKYIIHYTQIYRNFAKWSEDGSIEKVFYGSVEKLQKEEQLDLSVIQADATNVIAKRKGSYWIFRI